VSLCQIRNSKELLHPGNRNSMEYSRATHLNVSGAL